MGHGASSGGKNKANQPLYPGVDYPIQAPPQPPSHPPAYNEPLHVPVSFYPDNVYSTSTGNGVFAQIGREIDNFDAQLTETLDGNRYFNRVHDPSVPPAPGMVVCMTARHPMQPSSSSNFTPPAYSQPPPPSYPNPTPNAQYSPPSYPNNPTPTVQKADALPEKTPL